LNDEPLILMISSDFNDYKDQRNQKNQLNQWFKNPDNPQILKIPVQTISTV